MCSGEFADGSLRNLDNCGITDEDVEAGDLEACFENFGPANVVQL